MSTNRLFKLLIVMSLVIAVVLTVRDAVATTAIRSGAASSITCASLPSRYSLRSEYVKEADMWVLRTDDGPTGVDGGLVELLSGYRSCSG